MGFPSPAMDYQEQRMTIDVICGVDNNYFMRLGRY